MTQDDKWFEVWYSDGEEVLPTYILIVAASVNEWQGIRVVDPLKRNEVVFVGSTYDEVCTFLWDDEFHLIEGRIFPDDGW
ncbi:MAG: hypothetical protein IPJ30_09830 [Acidobacteria bacterium]|nr:hypothetical protein [Acidobacteriota bacterium]MBK8147146.1 hypothetical protein [Acidobacteriota bacterium]